MTDSIYFRNKEAQSQSFVVKMQIKIICKPQPTICLPAAAKLDDSHFFFAGHKDLLSSYSYLKNHPQSNHEFLFCHNRHRHPLNPNARFCSLYLQFAKLYFPKYILYNYVNQGIQPVSPLAHHSYT